MIQCVHRHRTAAAAAAEKQRASDARAAQRAATPASSAGGYSSDDYASDSGDDDNGARRTPSPPPKDADGFEERHAEQMLSNDTPRSNSVASSRRTASSSQSAGRSSSDDDDDDDGDALVDHGGSMALAPSAPDAETAERCDDAAQRASPRDRLRLPRMHVGPRRAADMITRMVERPADVAQQQALVTSYAAEPLPAGSQRKTDFPYEPTSDKFLRRYWERKAVSKEAWRLQRKHNRRMHDASKSRTREQPGGSVLRSRSSASSVAASPRSDDAPWDTSSYPMNHSRASEAELLSLRTLFCPKPNFICKLRVPNVDLVWLRKVMSGEVTGAAAVDTVKKMSTRTLRSLNLDALQDDATHYGDGDPYTQTVINSPRSVVVMLRNGVEAYNLLRRPPNFYTHVGEKVTQQVLAQRQERAEEERARLIASLQLAYDDVCATFSTERVVQVLKPAEKTEHSAALVRERAERDARQLQFLEERTKALAEANSKRREENSQKAMAIESLLQEKAEAKRRSVAAKAAKTAEELAAKKRVMERIEQQQQVITSERHARIESKHEELSRRVVALKTSQHQEAERNRQQKDARAFESKSRAEERMEERLARLAEQEAHRAEMAEQFRQRAEEERKALLQRQDQTREIQQLNKLRAAAMQESLRDAVTAKMDAADERLAEFHRERERERALQAAALRKRHEEIKLAVEMAHSMDHARAEAVMRKQEQTERQLEERERRRQEENQEAAEAHAFNREHKRQVVGITTNQLQFQKLCELSALQQREMEVDEFLQGKADIVRQTKQSRMDLRIKHHVMQEEADAAAVKQERDTAAAIYAITNPTAKYSAPPQLRTVAPRIDSVDPHKTATSNGKHSSANRARKAHRDLPQRSKSALA